jgi:hypothetical protein
MSNSVENRPRRGLGLADILILFAASAAALWWLQKPLEYRLTFVRDGRIIENLRPSTLVGAAFAATWGAAVLAIRLRPPRATWAGWRCTPGFVGCAAATVACLIKLWALLVWGAFEDYRFESWYVPSILGQLIEPAAMGVVGAWLTLWLAGAWRRERTLVDDLGILIGLMWIGLEALAWAALCLER